MVELVSVNSPHDVIGGRENIFKARLSNNFAGITFLYNGFIMLAELKKLAEEGHATSELSTDTTPR